jgi:hypothetical protein
MSDLQNAASVVETRPEIKPGPMETIPANPNEPFGVHHKIIEEIEELGRKYAESDE